MSVYAEILHHRELFANLFRRDFRAKYKGSVLGVLWSLVNPLVLMGIYTLVFSVLFPVSQVPHYPLYLLSGLAIWVFLAGSLPTSARSLLDNANLIKKVRFPRQLTAFSTVATQLVALAAILVVLIPVNLIVIPETRETIWLTIPLIVPGDRAGRRAVARPYRPPTSSSATSSTSSRRCCSRGSSSRRSCTRSRRAAFCAARSRITRRS